MTISASGAFSTASGTGATTCTVATAVIGDVRLFATYLYNGTSNPVSSISGGGVGTWAHVQSQGLTNSNNGEIWWGQVTSTTTPTTVTVAFTSSNSSILTEFASQMFSSTVAGPKWYIQTSNTSTGSTGTTLTWPSLTPVGGTQAYFGSAIPVNSASVGSTSGYIYQATSDTSMALYNPGITAASAPTCTQNTSGGWDCVGVVFAAAGSQSFFNFF